ncbi:MAG: aldo/keto reductase [Rectinemataceae bacterium]
MIDSVASSGSALASGDALQPGATCEPGCLTLPPVIFGISALGNLYRALHVAEKRAIVASCLRHTRGRAVFDGAGKYGAGLALEELGHSLRAEAVAPGAVLVSNKLGWRRTPLLGAEPTFEAGVWKELKHDAVQDISAEGILRCREEGDCLLGFPYRAELLSVHDPDEFIAAAGPDPAVRAARLEAVVAAYSSLAALRAAGEVKAIGIGAKDWRVAREIAQRVKLDWVMLACSLTVLRHPRELLDWIAALSGEGVAVIDSALFHGGFLTGGDYFDYRRIEPDDPADRKLLAWREAYTAACARAGVTTAHAAVAFARLVPGVTSVALNTSDPARVGQNVAMGMESVPKALWKDLAASGLIDRDLEFLP